MISKVFSTTFTGLNVSLVEIELDISSGLPAVIMVGLPDKSIQESKERIRTSFKSIGVQFPLAKVTINLAPANIIKIGTHYDLPICIGILQSIHHFSTKINLSKSIFIGELALDGSIRSGKGILPSLLWAKKNGFTDIYIPKHNLKEASLVHGLNIFMVDNLKQLVDHLNGTEKIEPVVIDEDSLKNQLLLGHEKSQYDMCFVKGQSLAKRALEIAAAGGHNVMLIGSPGSGKTLMARSFQTILPNLSLDELLEVAQIYSICGYSLDPIFAGLRPFRSPHHTSSQVSMVGGGSKITPGEISLAHRGVLFMDEFPEYQRETLEALRQPLEDGIINISRATGSALYPAKFILVAAANPTPSGFAVDQMAQNGFSSNPNSTGIAKYKAKFSGPIMDRIDLHVTVNQPAVSELNDKNLAEKSIDIKKRVQNAREIQKSRFLESAKFLNSEMNLEEIAKYCNLDEKTQDLLNKAIDKYKLSVRAYMRILKMSRTIADLCGSQNIEFSHLAESLQFRPKI